MIESDKKLHELGEKFERDKEKLEAQIDKIMNSKISINVLRYIVQDVEELEQ